MTGKEKAAAIRAELKTLGWNARQVSVRFSRCTYDTAIDVTIKDSTIAAHVVKGVVEQFTRVHRCEASGEILGGGNTFTSVAYDDDIVEAKARQLEPLIGERVTEIEGFEVTPVAGDYRAPERHDVSVAGRNHNDCIRCHDKRTAARALAIAIFDRGFDYCGRWISPGPDPCGR